MFSTSKNKGLTTQKQWKDSVLEVRKIYSDMSPKYFARWYAGKWGGKPDQVLKVIESN